MAIGDCGDVSGVYDDIEGTIVHDPAGKTIVYDSAAGTVLCEGLTTITYSDDDNVTIYFGKQGRTFPMTCVYRHDCEISSINEIEVPLEYQFSILQY